METQYKQKREKTETAFMKSVVNMMNLTNDDRKAAAVDIVQKHREDVRSNVDFVLYKTRPKRALIEVPEDSVDQLPTSNDQILDSQAILKQLNAA